MTNEALKRRRLKTLRDEYGIDITAMIEAVHALAQLTAQSEAESKYLNLLDMPPRKREQRLADTNARLCRHAERLQTVNRHMAALLMEEHLFLRSSLLGHCMAAAEAAKDQALLRSLRTIEARICRGGYGYDRSGRTGRPRRIELPSMSANAGPKTPGTRKRKAKAPASKARKASKRLSEPRSRLEPTSGLSCK